MRRLAVCGLLLATVATSCSLARVSSPGRGAGEAARLEIVRRGVEIAGDGSFRRVTGRLSVQPGDRVRTGKAGVARLRFADSVAELASLTELEVREDRVFLRRGSVLASGRLVVDAVGARADTDGDVRIDRTLTLRVGAYEGSATLRVGAARLRIARYREGSASPGFFPKVSRPLRVDAADRWDRRLLGDELELERGLEALRVGLDVREAAVPLVLQALGTPAFLPNRLLLGSSRLAPEEVVIAAAISAASPGPLGGLAQEAADLRQQGASWAVVAATVGADTEDVLSRLTRAIERGTSSPATSSPTASPPAASPSPRPSGSSPRPTSPPPSSPGPTSPPSPTPSPGIGDTVTDTVCRITLGALCLD